MLGLVSWPRPITELSGLSSATYGNFYCNWVQDSRPKDSLFPLPFFQEVTSFSPKSSTALQISISDMTLNKLVLRPKQNMQSPHGNWHLPNKHTFGCKTHVAFLVLWGFFCHGISRYLFPWLQSLPCGFLNTWLHNPCGFLYPCVWLPTLTSWEELLHHSSSSSALKSCCLLPLACSHQHFYPLPAKVVSSVCTALCRPS